MFRKLAIVSVTRRCNHHCIFCCEGDRAEQGDVPLSVVRKQLTELRARDYDGVNFMGAETTLRKDLFELLSLVRELGLRAALTTNGSRFGTPGFAEQVIPELASIEVSLPAADRETYRLITAADHFERVVAGLKHIGRACHQAADPPVVVVNTVVCRHNVAAPVQVARLLGSIDLGPRRYLHLIRARPQGRAVDGELTLDLESCSESFLAGVRAAKQVDVPVMFRGLPTCCAFEAVEHNFWTFEQLSRPHNAYLNREPVGMDTRVEDNENLHRKGTRYARVCHACDVRPLCPGLTEAMPDDSFVRPPSPCPTPRELSERMRRGPLAAYLF